MSTASERRLAQITVILTTNSKALISQAQALLAPETPAVKEAAAAYARRNANFMGALYRTAANPESDVLYQGIDDNA